MDRFAALAEPTRRQILEMLAAEGQLSATDIASRFDITKPAVSQHLKVLREAGLVSVERRAQQRIYRLNLDTLHELEDWAGRMRRLWNRRLDALDDLLKAETKL